MENKKKTGLSIANSLKKHCFFLLVMLGVFDSNHAYSISFDDSLKVVLKQSRDTNKVNVLNKLSFYYSERDKTSAFIFADQAIALSDQLNFIKGKSNALNNKGIACDVTGNYDSALFFYNQALLLAKSIKNPALQANIYNNIGLIYWNKGENESALNFYFAALKINEKSGNKKGLANVNSNIGLIYYDIGNTRKALFYQKIALKIREELKDNYGIGVSLTNIGLCYSNINKTDSTIYFYKKSIDYKKQSNDLYGLGVVYNDIALIYIDLNNFKAANQYFLMSVDIRLEINDGFGLATTYNNIARLYMDQKDYNPSLSYLKKSLEIALKLESKTKLSKVYLLLSKNYEYLRMYKEAYEYLDKYSEINFEIYNIEGMKKLEELQTKYETEKKEQQLKLHALEIDRQKYLKRVQFLLFLGLALLGLFIVMAYIFRIKTKQRTTLLQESNRQEKLRFKVMIESEEKERIRIAKDLHDGLGQILSTAKLNLSGLEDSVEKEDEHLLNNSIRIIDEAVSEVRNISHNLMPTAIMNYDITTAISVLVEKINDSANIKVNFDKETFKLQMTKEMEISLYRIVQEVLNNMIKHSQTKQIDIVLSSENQEINLKIQDYGIGFDTAQIEQSKGIGWQNIYSRVSMLNGKIDLDSQIGKGTVIQVNFSI